MGAYYDPVTRRMIEVVSTIFWSLILEGRSLLPWLHGKAPDWREYAVSEYDYGTNPAVSKLAKDPSSARLFMIADKRWKFIHAEGMRPQLFDMENDPNEYIDLGESAQHADIIDMMYERLGAWARRLSQRTTRSDAQIIGERARSARRGITLGAYDEDDIPAPLTQFYRGKPRPDPSL